MSRGFLIYAHNTSNINYLEIAFINANMIGYNMKEKVSVVTDTESYQELLSKYESNHVKSVFDQIIFVNYLKDNKNIRLFRDTANIKKRLPFYNRNRYSAYELSPYDETILLDADYLIQSNNLSLCWGSEQNIMINYEIKDIWSTRTPIPEFISHYGIRLYWATVVYFKKSAESEQLFTLIEHISKNYEYYSKIHYLNKKLFRNDFVFSMAIHLMNGFTDNKYFIPQLPISPLLTVMDFDDIYKINGINDITFLLEMQTNKDRYWLIRVKNNDVHIMNKWSLLRNSKKLLEVYDVR